jgi:hypothetical protein
MKPVVVSSNRNKRLASTPLQLDRRRPHLQVAQPDSTPELPSLDD